MSACFYLHVGTFALSVGLGYSYVDVDCHDYAATVVLYYFGLWRMVYDLRGRFLDDEKMGL